MLKTLVLIGLPGSGKSTVGKLIAQSEGWIFADSDELILDLVKRDYPSIYCLLEMYAHIDTEESRRYEYQVLSQNLGSELRSCPPGSCFRNWVFEKHLKS